MISRKLPSLLSIAVDGPQFHDNFRGKDTGATLEFICHFHFTIAEFSSGQPLPLQLLFWPAGLNVLNNVACRFKI
jgi:hypothetical protein